MVIVNIFGPDNIRDQIEIFNPSFFEITLKGLSTLSTRKSFTILRSTEPKLEKIDIKTMKKSI